MTTYTQPTPLEVVQFRDKTGLNQVDFGLALYASRTTVQNWERGVVPMPLGLWELAHLKLRPLLDAYEAERTPLVLQSI